MCIVRYSQVTSHQYHQYHLSPGTSHKQASPPFSSFASFCLSIYLYITIKLVPFFIFSFTYLQLTSPLTQRTFPISYLLLGTAGKSQTTSLCIRATHTLYLVCLLFYLFYSTLPFNSSTSSSSSSSSTSSIPSSLAQLTPPHATPYATSRHHTLLIITTPHKTPQTPTTLPFAPHSNPPSLETTHHTSFPRMSA
jgi:hypothetical protein